MEALTPLRSALVRCGRRGQPVTEQCLILLREKGRTQRWQPISPTLNAALIAHFDERGDASPDSQLLRYRNGTAVGRRRYDHLRKRVRTHLPWAEVHQVSAHWLRHTTLTWVERHFGQAVAHRYAGHSDSHRQATIGVYTKATLREVAQALAALTGEPHPLADGDPWPRWWPPDSDHGGEAQRVLNQPQWRESHSPYNAW